MNAPENHARRVGLYAWEGPNTIEILKTKYHNPKIDVASFERLYDPAFIDRARDTLGLTDLWMTYSWGFSDAREAEQYDYVHERVEYIRRQGLKTYAYVQGLNVVTDDFADEQFFCESYSGHRIPYSRGRHLICPSHPRTMEHLSARVRRAADAPLDGVYVDNILFGLMPFLVGRNFTPSFGCHCRHCQIAYSNQFGERLPRRAESQQSLSRIMEFRATQIQTVLAELSRLVRERGKLFGVNLFDPFRHTSTLYFGYDLARVKPLLDYYFIENHMIEKHGTGVHNAHVAGLLSDEKPTFVLSYRNGIGRDGMYDQRTIENVYADANRVGYNPCIKGSEFVTHNRWHTFDLDAIASVVRTTVTTLADEMSPQRTSGVSLPYRSFSMRLSARVIDRYVPWWYDLLYHSPLLWALFVRTGLYTYALRKECVFRFESDSRKP